MVVFHYGDTRAGAKRNGLRGGAVWFGPFASGKRCWRITNSRRIQAVVTT